MQGHARWDSTPCARRGYPPLVEGAIFPIESWEGGEDIDEVVICVVGAILQLCASTLCIIALAVWNLTRE